MHAGIRILRSAPFNAIKDDRRTRREKQPFVGILTVGSLNNGGNF